MIAVMYSNANHDDAVAIDEDDKSNFMLTDNRVSAAEIPPLECTLKAMRLIMG